MLKPNISPKAHESSFPTICLPNGNVKFSHTNRKHFTVGDPMWFPIVKMENKNPQNVLLRLDYVDPHLIQQCLGPPQAPPQIAAPTVEALFHTYAVMSSLVTMVRSKFAPKVPLSVDRLQNPNTCLIPGPVRPVVPNGCRMRSAVFAQCTEQTDRPTDRSFTGKFDDYKPLRSESDAA